MASKINRVVFEGTLKKIFKESTDVEFEWHNGRVEMYIVYQGKITRGYMYVQLNKYEDLAAMHKDIEETYQEWKEEYKIS